MRVALVHDVGAEPGQPVDDPEDGVLVAGDQARGEHDGVAGLDVDPVVVAVRRSGPAPTAARPASRSR